MIAINNIKATHTIKVIDKAYGQNVNTLSVIALSCQQKQHVDRLSFLTVLLSLSFCDIKLLTIMWLRKISPLLFMLPVGWPISVELSVSQSVCQSVRPKTLMAITFLILNIATWYLAYMCISWSCTFSVVKGEGEGHPSRSNVKYKASVCLSENFNIGHNFFNIGVHAYLIELHILIGERSRSSFKVKVKGQILQYWR